MMSQKKFYKYATWGLLLLNIAMLAFFLLTKPRPPHHSLPRAFQGEVINILDLNSQQAEAFSQMASSHHQKMKSINEQQQLLLQPYFDGLVSSAGNMDKDSVLNQYQQLEREKLEVTYQHFEEIKSILEEDQLVHFDRLMESLIDRLLMGGNNPPPPPKGF